ncbi:hypothetical protein GCM10027347_27320 [Larkinella harenae]
MKNRFLLFFGALFGLNVTISVAQDLNFNTTAPLYPDGATSHSYTGIGTPAVNVDVSVSGPGKFSNLAPRRAGTGLYTPNIKFATSSETQHYSFTFSDPVTGLEFSLNALQYNIFPNTDHNYQDKITILATDEFGNTVMPVIPPGVGYSVNGNEILATSTDASNVDKVRFPTQVKTVVIVFGNGHLAGPIPNGQGFTIGHMEWSGVVLPVGISYFRAKPVGSVIQLAWETTFERNADYFTVEHSLDVENFTPIGRIKAVGDATRPHSYAFVDDRAHRMTNYYRLQQVDKDGSKNHSKVIAVRRDLQLPDLLVYPNPSDGRTIHIQFNDGKPASLRLTDLNGRALDFRIRETDAGQVILVPVVPLSPGIYLLHTLDRKTVRLVVK